MASTMIDPLTRQKLNEYLRSQLERELDPTGQQKKMRLLAQRQAIKDRLASTGRFISGMDEASSIMGGTQPGTTLPAMASKFEQEAAASRKDLMPKPTAGGIDPKIFKYLDAMKTKKDKDSVLKYGPGEFDPKTRETRKFLRTKEGKKVGEGILTKSKDFEVKEAHWRRYRNDPVTKKSDLLAVNYQKIKNANENPSPAGDISLIFGFMKMIDPGSTVREGEFATAANAGSVPTRVWGLYNKILEGERLTDTQRQDFTDQALFIWDAQHKLQRQVDQRYEEFAKQNNIDFTPHTWDIGDTADKDDEAKQIGSPVGTQIDYNGEIWEKVKPGSDKEKGTWQKLGK